MIPSLPSRPLVPSHLLFVHPQIDHRADVGQRQRAFGHVGGQHEMAHAKLRRLEDVLLVLGVKQTGGTAVLKTRGKPVNFYGISMGFLWDLYGIY